MRFQVYYVEMVGYNEYRRVVVKEFDNYEDASNYIEGTNCSVRIKEEL